MMILIPTLAHAGAPVHGAKAAAMATAFVAVADDPSAIMHNPAGLIQTEGTNLYAGATAVILSTKYQSPSGESEETDFQVFFPPHLFLDSNIGMKDVKFGLGIFSPFGIGGRKWSDEGLNRYLSTESTIATVAVNPVVSWLIRPGLSVGGGIYYMHAFNTAEKMLDQSSLGAGDGHSRLEVDGGGWGFNFGILLKPWQKFSLGMNYRSKVKVDQSGTIKLEGIAPALQPLFGGSQFETDVRTANNFPQIASLGAAYRPTKKLTLSFDIEWVEWSSFHSQALDFEKEVPSAGFTDMVIDLNWKDQWLYKLGVEYRLNSQFALRGGYAYVTTPVPDQTLAPANPDADNHNFTIGLGYQRKRWVFDAFYQAEFFEDRTVNNSIQSGTYENFCQYIGLSIGYSF